MPEQIDLTPEIIPNSGAEEVQTGQLQPGKTGTLLDLVIDDELSIYISNLLRNDVADKEEGSWTEKRLYDINSYEGNKRPTNFPWPNCCNFPVPLTPTLVDTAHANIMASIFYDPENTVEVQGVGIEDIRKAPILGQLLNWQINKEVNAYEVWDKAVFRALRDGTGIIKVIQSVFEKKIIVESVPIDNIYVPLDATGFQIGQTDHVIQIIGLNPQDIEQRMSMKDPLTGKPIYEGLDELPSGMRLGTSAQARMIQKDFISGSKIDQRNTRDLKYIAECYLTYWVKTGDKKESAPVEIVAWISHPNGKILRKALNKTGKRPFVYMTPYPREDRFYGMSLPEKIRFIQEELDYAHNQNLNAADRSIAPPTFYDPLTGFDPNMAQIVPGASFPVTGGRAPSVLAYNVDPIFERQEDRYWDLAERLTGLTELFQGRQAGRKQTLGEAKLRNNRSEIRFKALYQRFEKGWSDMMDLIYFYDNLYMDRDKKIKILGVADYKEIGEIFPEGKMEGQYNFTFKNPPVTEMQLKKEEMEQLLEVLLGSALVASDKASTWKILKRLSELKGERDLEVLVSKPQEANILSPEEIIQRIVSGQYDIVPEPGMDGMNAMMRLQLFTLTDTFKNLDHKGQQAFMKIFGRIQKIVEGQMLARMDGFAIKRGPEQNLPDQSNGAPAQPMEIVR